MRTAAAGTARLFAAWSLGSPVPGAVDRRCEGVADLTARRARVSQSLFFTDRITAELTDHREAGPGPGEFIEQSEMIYDGANAYVRVGGSWTGFSLADPSGPRQLGDPLWPLDVLFGAGNDAVQVGPEQVRGVPAVRCRLTADLGRADAALTAVVSVPTGPYRSLGRLPVEVWLDGAGLARRIAVNHDPSATADKRIWSIVELWDFGVSVEITPPAAGEVLAPAEAYRTAHEDAPGPNG